jgi:hypothetical protein
VISSTRYFFFVSVLPTMARVFLASSLFALIAWPVACIAEVESVVALETALEGDDQCFAERDEQGSCTLSALQLKAATSVAADDAVEGACSSGMVGAIRKMGPSCLDSCKQACRPLAEAVDAYLKRGGYPAAKRVICRHRREFGCAVSKENLHKCKHLLQRAGTFGFKLPQSPYELHQQCR